VLAWKQHKLGYWTERRLEEYGDGDGEETFYNLLWLDETVSKYHIQGDRVSLKSFNRMFA
jgi:hypothetical protein